MIRTFDARCRCGQLYEVFERGGTSSACPRCGASGPESRERLYSPLAVVGTGDVAGVGRIYPYFDRGLGRMVRNRQERDRVMVRRGLQEWEPSDLERAAARNASASAARKTRIAARQEQLRTDPAYADYRRAVDSGMVAERTKKTQQAAVRAAEKEARKCR